MKLKHLRRWQLGSALGAAVLFVCAAASPRQGFTLERDRRADSMNRVVALLDGYVQNRFEQDNGNFGLERIPPPVDGHGSVTYRLAAITDREKEILAAVNAQPCEYIVEFLHCNHVPGHARGARTPRRIRILPDRMPVAPRMAPGESDEPHFEGRNSFMTLVAAHSNAVTFQPYDFSKAHEEYRRTTEAQFQRAADALLLRLKRGDSVDLKSGEWRLALRPVRASNASCINCHEGAKGGDTLGVMIYAVRPNTKALLSGKGVSRRPGS